MSTRAANPRTRGKPTRVPASRKPSKKNKSTKGARVKDKEDVVRGKEVSVRDTADEAQIIYGHMRVGGNVTYIETSADSPAYLITGSSGDNNQIVFTSRITGTTGNAYTVTIENPPGTRANTAVALNGNNLIITLARNGSGSTATVSQVIAAVNENLSAVDKFIAQRLVQGDNGIVQAMSITSLSYGGGSFLHQVITIAGCEIDGVDSLFLDERQVVFGATPDPRWGTGIWANKVFMAVQNGNVDQPAQPDLMGQMPTRWTSAHRQRGWASIYLILVWDANLFPEGIPGVSLQVRGKKVWDPRTNTTVFTENAALCVGDFLTNTDYGYGIPRERIHTQTWIDAANACDNNFVINGVFDVGSREDTLRQLEQAMAGEVVESAGYFFILPGVWRDSVLDLDENDLRGEVSMNTHVSMSDRFNSVRGTYVSPTDNYAITDFPPYKNNTYIAEDGKQIFMDLALNFVTDPGQAQRIAKIELEKVRQGITLTWPGKVSCYAARAGQNVRVNYARFGMVNKYFKIDELDFDVAQDGTLGVDLILRETASGIFDWNDGMETPVDIAPNTNLPNPFYVGIPSNVQLFSGTSELYLKADGTVYSRLKVQWQSSIDEYTVTNGGFEIQYKRHDSPTWAPGAIVGGSVNFVHIADVEDKIYYDVRIRAFNSLGVKSAWVENLKYQVLGKTEPPSTPTNFTVTVSDLGIIFLWDQIPDLDRSEYEIRVGGGYFEQGDYVWRGKGTTARWENKRAGAYRFYLKSIDTSGNYSAVNAIADLIINGPGQVSLTFAINGPNVVFKWIVEQGAFLLNNYVLSFGPEYVGSTQIANVNATTFVYRADWGGVRTFWLAPVDIAGNIGGPGVAAVNITLPNPVKAFVGTTVNSNVLLDWKSGDPSSLPIDHYNVYKGPTYNESTQIGIKYGTFHTYIERFGGQFFYHVEPVDTAGNIGPYQSTSVQVQVPDDFYIKAEHDLLSQNAISLTNAVQSPRQPYKLVNDIFFPVETTKAVESLPRLINPIRQAGIETFDQWWTNNGWNNLQEAISQGYNQPFLAPTSLVPGQVKWLVDYEVTFSSSFIDFQYELLNLGDAVDLIPSINISVDNVTFTPFYGASQVFATNFRYVEYVLDFQGTSNTAFAKISVAKTRISLKRVTEYIVVQCFASDYASGGTPFSFTKNFLDVEDIQGTVWGTTGQEGVPIINFLDDPNPNGGRVILVNTDGDPIDGQVRVQVTGAINP